MKIYRQTTYETCLACCLLMLIRENYSRAKEISIWENGWGVLDFGRRFNFMIAQVSYVAKNYRKGFKIYIEEKNYYRELVKKKPYRIEIFNVKIDINLISKLIKENILIVYVDNFYLRKRNHSPHFILVIKQNKKSFLIGDPLRGRKIYVSKKVLIRAIRSLKNHLAFSPLVITNLN